MKTNYLFILIIIVVGLSYSACEQSDGSLVSSTGTGGSLARFTIGNDYLYVVSREELKPFDISDPWSPEKQNEIQLGRDIETIFPYQDHLFIGAETGMHIYNIDDPKNPKYISSYAHVRSCDPVVIQGNYAYVTLRANMQCGGALNVLEVIDISNLSTPQNVNTINLQSPYGLGIDGTNLYVCEGKNGIQAFDATDPVKVKKDTIYKDHHATDVILNNGVMIVTGEEGVYQYDYITDDTLELLSQIKIHELN